MQLNKIYNENCLTTMGNMPDEFVDCVVTSPPYDNLRTYNGYCFDFESITKELFRVIKSGGVVIWVVADETVNGSETGTSFRQALFFKDIGFRLHDTMIYGKNNAMPQTGNRYHQDFEYMFAFSKGSPKTFNPIMVACKYPGDTTVIKRLRTGEQVYTRYNVKAERKVGNIFSYNVGGGHTSKDTIVSKHPAVFPEKLVADQINTWTNKGDLVYDPFMGSGTTAKIAYILGRNWIGSEISQEYVDIAEERINAYMENIFEK